MGGFDRGQPDLVKHRHFFREIASLVRAGVRPRVPRAEVVTHAYQGFNREADVLASGREQFASTHFDRPFEY